MPEKYAARYSSQRKKAFPGNYYDKHANNERYLSLWFDVLWSSDHRAYRKW